jgi:NAD dependent epimerase/dehydratase family
MQSKTVEISPLCRSGDRPLNSVGERLSSTSMKTCEWIMKIAVAGATGRVGRHVVDVLKAGGHDVVAMSRYSGVA